MSRTVVSKDGTNQITVEDHGEVGVSIQRREKSNKGRFVAVEDLLIPRDMFASVCRILASLEKP